MARFNKLQSNTCLAVLRDKKGYLWFAGDRRQSWGMSKAQIAPRSKVTYRNGVLLAGTGTSSICDIVTDQMTVPDVLDDTYYYMTNVFVPALYDYLKIQGYLEKDTRVLNLTEEQAAVILVGVNSDLFELSIDTDGVEFVAIDAPYAHGCGGQPALGSLLTTEHMRGFNEVKRLQIALKVASIISPGCDDNIDILTNSPTKGR